MFVFFPHHQFKKALSLRMQKIIKDSRTSGVLVLANKHLKDVPREVFNMDSVSTDANWWECVELKKLDLSHNSICAISPEISKLCDLNVVLLSNNAVSEFPVGLFQVSQRRPQIMPR